MNKQQRHMIINLEECSFGVGSAEKYFVRDMNAKLRDDPNAELTPRQDWYLRRIYWRYRGQIGHDEPKPDDFDNPPPLPPKTKAQKELAEREARGEVIVCRAPNPSGKAAAELERLKAWNEGRAR